MLQITWHTRIFIASNLQRNYFFNWRYIINTKSNSLCKTHKYKVYRRNTQNHPTSKRKTKSTTKPNEWHILGGVIKLRPNQTIDLDQTLHTTCNIKKKICVPPFSATTHTNLGHQEDEHSSLHTQTLVD